MNTTMTRRSLLLRSAGALGGLSLGLTGVARAAVANEKILVRVFLRGGIDGLNTVVPYADDEYYAARPSIAIPRPAVDGGVLKLDDRFGLHPALAPLVPMYRERSLAIVHAVGSVAQTRSHFDAQDILESGSVEGRLRDGWIGRVSGRLGGGDFAAVATGRKTPLALRGADALAVGRLAQFGLAGKPRLQNRLERGFAALYGDGDGPVERAGLRALDAIRRVRALDPKTYRPAGGVDYGRGPAAQQLRDVAILIKGEVGVRVACVDIGGWDTHTAEKNRLAKGLGRLGGALAAFHRDLGDRMKDVVVLVVSEFGRTVKENGSGGTDHGHGTIMMLLGGPVAGGRVYGRWPGIGVDARYEGRDLAVTTDFRTVFGEVLERHLAVENGSSTFPGERPNALPLGLIRA